VCRPISFDQTATRTLTAVLERLRGIGQLLTLTHLLLLYVLRSVIVLWSSLE